MPSTVSQPPTASHAAAPSRKRALDSSTSSPQSASSQKRPKTDSPDATTSALPADFFAPTSAALIALPPATMGDDRDDGDAIPELDELDALDAEWAKFQDEVAPLAAPTTTATVAAPAVISSAPVAYNAGARPEDERAEEEEKEERRSGKEDAQAEQEEAAERLLEEFDTLASLEERVRKLKARREEIRNQGGEGVVEDGMAVEVEREEDDDDEDDDELEGDEFFSR